ncbi:Kelch-like protein 17 [Streptomyces venezuelae]|uniref:Kelch-like protein 17 n=1 Tax=Streptomyces venezuelae TaxID=54571 RepID=A0A5P2DFK9_STRVZ|nr:kelch repeat-containing protein [Streptomyces venezuelae]QES51779.1 Kelch-like protein 17 [Streptomyces venezuelae]
MTTTTPRAATEQWTAQGDLPEAASWYGQYDTAVPLGNEKKQVLVVAGADGRSAALAKAWLFTPGATPETPGTWSAAGQVPGGARRLHTATLLADGDVLVTGGTAAPGLSPALKSAAVYHPKTNTWTPADDLHEARWGHAAVRTADNKVLVCGGYTVRSQDSARALASAELYHPGDRSWTPLKPMNDARGGHTALAFPDGRVLVCGGTAPIAPGREAALAFCELYTPAIPAWTPTGNLTRPRSRHQALHLSATTALVIGGSTPGVPGDGTYDPYALIDAELYDLATQKWTPRTAVRGGRGHHRAVPLGTGRVLVIGGTGDTEDAAGYQSVLVYDTARDAWAPAAGLATGRWAFAAAALSGTEVLVTGGTVRSGLAAAGPQADDLTRTTEIFRTGDGS